MMRTVNVNGCTIHILPVVKGLVSEADAVAAAFDEVVPDVIALSVAREEITGLRKKEDYEKYEMSDLEETYAAFLETFGEVEIPPPCYVKCIELGDEKNAVLVPLDMNDELYSTVYCEKVRTGDMIRESFFARRATRKKYDLSSPQAFAIDWDRRVNRAKGFRELEEQREKHFEKVLRRLSLKYHNILAVIECERAEGVGVLLSGAEVKDEDDVKLEEESQST